MHDFHNGRTYGHPGRRYRAEDPSERGYGRRGGGRGGMSPRGRDGDFERGEPRGRRGGRPDLGHPHFRGHRGRAQRGDVRAAVLRLLAEHSMHGYQMMNAIAERTGGSWRVSPGAIYPTIAQLEDEGLVRTEAEGGRKLVVLTDAGRTYVEDETTAPADPFAAMTDEKGTGLRDVFEGLAVASKTLGRTGTPTQIAAAREVLEKARRDLYLILADDPGAKG
ncbi:hypothetical protein GCM10009547_44130 [Sporichthya brevicatena]|uniref:Transcription regulator PadR N-terminal domain-containing protein n=1 Tax=Sporichthya brevicatena TaxID=171442 RepID=A0ABN1HAE0_9ACTN